MSDLPPEAEARQQIQSMLTAAGWEVQDPPSQRRMAGLIDVGWSTNLGKTPGEILMGWTVFVQLPRPS
jgi:hypothetical protein